MAKLSDLSLLPIEEEDDDLESQTLAPSSLLSHSILVDDETLVSPIFSPQFNRPDYDDQLTLSLDLFDRCPPPETLDTSDFAAFDAVEPPMASDYLGLGLGFDHQEDRPIDHGDGLRIVGFGSDSDSEEDPSNQDPSLPLCWDSVRLDDDERRDFDEDFEWEEVDRRLDEMDFLSMMVGERSRMSVIEDEDYNEEEEAGNVDWELLLAVSNVDVEDGDSVNPSEFEIMFEQFADHDSVRGSLPAAKAVVNNLPEEVLTQDDVDKNNAICAVCKDEILIEEKVRRLPCLHHYHGECILPWLGMRNTCPVCRYELLTDDAEHESLESAEEGEE